MEQHEAISKANAEHYTWGQGCEGWYLMKHDQLAIIEERMPPGTSETWHRHTNSRQFFFVLSGCAVMEHGDEVTRLEAGTGLEIPPGLAHRIRNAGETALEFLVTSHPPSHGDRLELND